MTAPVEITSPLTLEPVTISNGTSLSGATSLGGKTLIGLLMPAAWTSASLSFQGSLDNTNFYDLHDGTGETTASAAASVYIVLDATKFRGIPYLKVRSGTSGSGVNQGADRNLVLIAQPVA